MNIIQVLPELNVGGVETGTVDFAKYLRENGHGSVVVSNGGPLVEDVQRGGSKHYALPVHKKTLWGFWKTVRRLRAIIKEERADIVHARSRVPAWIAFFACRGTQAHLITTCHGYYHSKFFSQVMGWPKIIITPSEVIARHMIDDFGVNARAIRCIPRSVDLDRFKKQQHVVKKKARYTVIIVGRITALKGHEYFFKAMAQVSNTMPNIRIKVVGSPPAKKESYLSELKLLTKRLGIDSKIDFLGTRQDVPDLVAAADCLVMSSIVPESFGRVILEAQAVGVPVVATKVGGVIDIIDHEKTGLLVLPKDVDGMAKAVIRILNDRALAARLAVSAKEKLLDHFTLEKMCGRTLAVYEELINTVNILVIKLSSIGDVILVTASLKVLRKNFPNGKIYCLVGEESRKVLQACPYLDGLIIYDAKGRDKGLVNFFKLSQKLRKYRFDKVVDLQNNRKSHLLAFLSFAKASYGYDNKKWGKLLSDPIKDVRKDVAPVDHQLQVLRRLKVSFPDKKELELWPGREDHDYVDKLLDSHWLKDCKNMVGINVAASAKWQTKNWPVKNIARFCDLCAAEGIRVFITGMEKDRALVDELNVLTKSKPASFIGKTDVLQLAALISRARVYISSDSAPLHIAAAMKTPVIALFGPTDARRHSPPAEKLVVVEKDLPCAPCYSARCLISTHACMKEITPAEIMEEVKRILGETP